MSDSSPVASTAPPLTADDTIMSQVYYWFRSFYIPTSPNMLLTSQKNIFNKFVQQPVQHKRYVLSSGDYLNYIDMKGVHQSVPSAARNHPGAVINQSGNKKPTLILMHGYGSGLAMFFGE